MKKVLKYYDVLHFDQEISEKAIQLIDNYKLSHNLQIPDAIIGATALVHNIPLFTYNLKDFPVYA
jgi:predicted nucleic acid-binding protein